MSIHADDAAAPGHIPPLNPLNPPPADRYCDVVLDGGVINGVVYPGFLMELARKFHFRSVGGTSVGAIAAALAAACEYNRRHGREAGFNEVLAKMPGELAEWVDDAKQVTRIQSLFQPDVRVQPLFDFCIDLFGDRSDWPEDASKAVPKTTSPAPSTEKGAVSIFTSVWDVVFIKARRHLGPNGGHTLAWALVTGLGVWAVAPFHIGVGLVLWLCSFFAATCLIHPIGKLMQQVRALYRLEGWGACTGMPAKNSTLPSLTEWMHEGIQKGAGVPMHRPLTFADLWAAPGAPDGPHGLKEAHSIEFRAITACLSHGRIYELPLAPGNDPVYFRLSEFKRLFPTAVVDHLRRVSSPVTEDSLMWLWQKMTNRLQLESRSKHKGGSRYQQLLAQDKDKRDQLRTKLNAPEDVSNGLFEPDIRILPREQLPIVVAARLSMSCPILFTCVPLLSLNRDCQPEDTDLVRLWFSDGGIGSNFPVHLFDKALPRWPTFALRILDEPPRKTSKGDTMRTFLPYSHRDGAQDNLLSPRSNDAFTQPSGVAGVGALLKVLFSMYTTAKDGHDQSLVRMPHVRNRVAQLYLNGRTKNMLNLKLSPRNILDLALNVGRRTGKNAAQAFLQELEGSSYLRSVNVWHDHRWVRFHMLLKGLRTYVAGFQAAAVAPGLPGTPNQASLVEQIDHSTRTAPLATASDPEVSDELPLTNAQAEQLRQAVKTIALLEQQLNNLDMAQPYEPTPMPNLRFQPLA